MNRVRFAIIASLGALLAACGPLQSDTEIATAAVASSEVRRLADGAVVGSSRLQRNRNGVRVVLQTTALPVGHAVTLWWVVFNQPEYCDGPCGSDDFPGNGGDPRVEASMLHAAGHVIGWGRTGFGAHLSSYDTSAAVFGPGLTHPLGAEIHSVVRTHGEALPGRIDEQIHTLNGACNPVCSNLQAARHLP